MELPRVYIKNQGRTTSIYMDGKEIKGVTRCVFSHNRNENNGRPKLTLEILADRVVLDTALIPALPEAYESFYVSRNALVDAGIATEEEMAALQ